MATADGALGSASNPIDLTVSSEVKLSQLRGSPVKVVTGKKYQQFASSLDVSDSESDADSDSVAAHVKPKCSTHTLQVKSEIKTGNEHCDTCKEDDIMMNSVGIPIYERPPPKYSACKIMQILLNPSDDRKIARKRPLEANGSCTYVVDVSMLAHANDIKKDMYGKWLHKGSHTDYFKCSYGEDDDVLVEKVAPGASGSDVFRLRRLHSVHPSSNDFRRVLAVVFDSQNQPHQYCLVVYYLPNNFTPKVVPHGNSKTNKPFYPTLPSTMSAMKAECLSGGPKAVVGKVSARFGGVLTAVDSCELPRCEQQVSDLKRRQKVNGGSFPGGDELAIVMQNAFLEDRDHHFIRDIRMIREPAIIVALDRQLDDLVKFCTDSQQWGVMTVDPTFCLGDFDVTVITYQHLLLQCRRTSSHPIFIGPVMIHYRKTFSSYVYFASTLVGLRSDLSNLRCFGTDGEEPLFNAFQHEFPIAIHLLCCTHVRRNIKAKLHELGVDEQMKQIVLADVFGKQVGTHHVEGLVDSNDEAEFERGLDVLSEKWTNMGKSMVMFVKWFVQYKSSPMKNSMLKCTRKDAGLGDPPPLFTTNASESVNALLKHKVDYKKSELSVFLEKLKEVVDDQERELERAVINRGKYRFSDEFQNLTKQESQWFLKMSVDQRKAHLMRVASATLHPPRNSASESMDLVGGFASREKTENLQRACRRRLFSTLPATVVGECSQTQASSSHTITDYTVTESDMYDSDESDDITSIESIPELYDDQSAGGSSANISVNVNEFSCDVLTPTTVLDAIWNKASELLKERNAVVKAPGCNDKARMVKSYSGVRPHLVVAKKNGQYACDNSCPNWRSLSICAHVVAAAEDNGDLTTFISWFKKVRKSLNITKLVTSNMPAGRGRKGTVPPRKKMKKASVKSRVHFSDVIQEQSFKDSSAMSELGTSCSVGGRTVQLSCSGGSINVGRDGCLFATGGNLDFTLPKTPPTTVTVAPPPLIRCASSSPDGSTFSLAFIKGNIRVCRGCKQHYRKPTIPPMDLCIRHQEWQEFKGPSGAVDRRFGNVYYHLNLPCVRAKYSSFEPTMLQITPSVAMQLLPVHTEYIMEHMPGRL